MEREQTVGASAPAEPHLVAYIRRYSGQFSREAIAARLRKSGVSESDILRSFSAAYSPRSGDQASLATPAPFAMPTPTPSPFPGAAARPVWPPERTLATVPTAGVPAISAEPATISQFPRDGRDEIQPAVWKRFFAFMGLLMGFGILAGVEYFRRELKTPAGKANLAALQVRAQKLRDAPAALPKPVAASAAARVTIPGKGAVELSRERLEGLKSFESFARLAQASLQRGRPGDAVRQVEQALSFFDSELHGPESRRGLIRLRSAAYSAAGRRQAAIAELESIVGEDPAAPELLYEMARLSYAGGDYRGAIGYAERLAAAAPAAPAGYALSAAAHAQSGSPRRAIRFFSSAIERIGNDARFKDDPAQQANLLFNRGALYANLGDRKRAFKDISAAIRLDAKVADYFAARAELYDSYGKRRSGAKDRATARSLKAAGLVRRDLSLGALPAAELKLPALTR